MSVFSWRSSSRRDEPSSLRTNVVISRTNLFGAGMDDPVAGVEQVPGQQTAAAPQLEHEAVSLAHGLEQGQDPGRRGVSVEPEPQVVHEGQIVAVVERVGGHGDRLCPVTTETINGTTLAYDVAGEGEPLILIHGSWGERQTWAFIVPGLAESFRVVSYDRRGHGESVAPPDAGTVHDDVADAAALIEGMDAAPAYVVANSYGSCIALRLAAERPELVKPMV